MLGNGLQTLPRAPDASKVSTVITVQVSTVQFRSVQNSTVQYRSVQYNTEQVSTQCSQYSTVQVSTVQYSRVSTFQYSTVVSSVHLMSVSSLYLTMSPQDLLLSSASVSELLILGFVAELTDRLFLLELQLHFSTENEACLKVMFGVVGGPFDY